MVNVEYNYLGQEPFFVRQKVIRIKVLQSRIIVVVRKLKEKSQPVPEEESGVTSKTRRVDLGNLGKVGPETTRVKTTPTCTSLCIVGLRCRTVSS